MIDGFRKLKTDSVGCIIEKLSGCSPVGKARGLGPRDRRFESCHSDPSKPVISKVAGFFYCVQLRSVDHLKMRLLLKDIRFILRMLR